MLVMIVQHLPIRGCFDKDVVNNGYRYYKYSTQTESFKKIMPANRVACTQKQPRSQAGLLSFGNYPYAVVYCVTE